MLNLRYHSIDVQNIEILTVTTLSFELFGENWENARFPPFHY